MSDLPWRIGSHNEYVTGGDKPIAIYTASGELIANNAAYYPPEIDPMYADMIVRAVNAYDVMKEALEDIARDRFGAPFSDGAKHSLERRDVARKALQVISEPSA